MCCQSKHWTCFKIWKVFVPISENPIINFQCSSSRLWVTIFLPFNSTPSPTFSVKASRNRMHEKVTASPTQFCAQTTGHWEFSLWDSRSTQNNHFKTLFLILFIVHFIEKSVFSDNYLTCKGILKCSKVVIYISLSKIFQV